MTTTKWIVRIGRINNQGMSRRRKNFRQAPRRGLVIGRLVMLSVGTCPIHITPKCRKRMLQRGGCPRWSIP